MQLGIKKTHVTFSDVHLLVKQKIINNLYFNKSTKNGDMLKFKTHDFTELINYYADGSLNFQKMAKVQYK